ncbi:tryptophan synthase subunit alpha [Carboxydothermus pertinax]|uniref:Tryptophan synthase alpha chain n=2 Tax=Carboxydothermus pertinax TaxID=870242 RepID=A0A1L8CUR5_9THEO|nr:tryptophan synthase subunit alpha [Carboxydothermus pertinax]
MFSEKRIRGEKALITYTMGGDPDLSLSLEIIKTLAASGADLIEVGLPFSDPLADGPVIQKAGQRALAADSGPEEVLALIAAARKDLSLPLVIMSYLNPIFQIGIDEFLRRAAGAGADGLIIPDLPAEEGEEIRAAAAGYGLDLIPLVAPTTGQKRLEKIVSQASGFIYCVSVTGVTGARDNLPVEVIPLLERVQAATKLPVCLGFGISTPEQAMLAAPHCDGIIVGSALVALVEEYTRNKINKQEMLKLMAERVAALKLALRES